MRENLLIYINDIKAEAIEIASRLKSYLKNKYNINSYILSLKSKKIQNNTSLIIVIGGDGSVLRATQNMFSNNINIPILAINLGQLGFLAEIDKNSWQEVIDQVFKGEYLLSSKSLLEVVIKKSDGTLLKERALNDIVIRGSRLNKILYFGIDINGEHFLDYGGDGIIFSSPTGSTAYSFSAGGPILESTLNAFAMTPICPHSLYNKALVLEKNSFVNFYLSSKIQNTSDAILFVDGILKFELKLGYNVKIEFSQESIKMLSLKNQTYINKIKSKLL